MSDLYHIESEQSVIGALLQDPAAIDHIDWLVEGDFYREDHRTIFRAISLMVAEKKPVDAITVAEALLSSGVRETDIGLAYLGELAQNVPSSANIRRYAEVVVEKRMRRDLLAASARIAELATADSAMSAAHRIDEAAGIVFALSEKSSRDEREAQLVGTVLADVIQDIQDRFERGGAIVGLPTGFADLDEMTSGFQGGDLIIVAGRPSMGKTAFAINVAEHVATNMDKSVLVFSMEMGKKQLVERSIASLGSINMKSIKNGQLNDDDFHRLSFAMGKLHGSKFVIDDRPALSIAQIRSRARRVARRNGLDLVVVDYIQLATGDMASKNGSREQEVSSVSRGLKAIAKEFNVPVIALSQLSRKVEERADRRPMMSDLRESGAIEQDADVILMMYRDEYYNKDRDDNKGIAEVIIGKQRMGETGKVYVSFQGQYSRFGDLSHDAKMGILRTEQSKVAPRRSSRGLD